MIERWGEVLNGPRVAAPALICAALLLAMCDDAAAQAQPAPPAQAQPPAAPPPAAQPPRQKDGFFDAIGRWWDKSAADFDANLKKMKSQIDAANDRNAQA